LLIALNVFYVHLVFLFCSSFLAVELGKVNIQPTQKKRWQKVEKENCLYGLSILKLVLRILSFALE
jgi:hypothetical protein